MATREQSAPARRSSHRLERLLSGGNPENLPPAKIPILPKPIDFEALRCLIREEGSARSVDS